MARLVVPIAALLLSNLLATACSEEKEESLSPCETACQSAGDRCSLDSDIVTQCQTLTCSFLLPDGCAQALETMSCQEWAARQQSATDVCFPRCSTASADCVDETITLCFAPEDDPTDLRSYTMDCAALCEEDGARYVGVCDSTYGNETSTTGSDVCWCDP